MNFTQEQSSQLKVANVYFSNLFAKGDYAERKLEFLQYSKDALRMTALFKELYKKYSKLTNLSSDEEKFIFEWDLLGLLHLSPSDINLDKINQGLILRKNINQFYSQTLNQYIDLEESALLDKVIGVRDSLSAKVQDVDLVNKLNIELNIILNLLIRGKKLSDILRDLNQSEVIIQKIFLQPENLINYLNFWLLVRAIDQDYNQFENIYDDARIAGFWLPPTKSEVINKLNSFTANPEIFINGQVTLSDNFRQDLKNRIESVSKLFFHEKDLLKNTLQLLASIPYEQLVPLVNFALIINSFNENTNKIKIFIDNNLVENEIAGNWLDSFSPVVQLFKGEMTSLDEYYSLLGKGLNNFIDFLRTNNTDLLQIFEDILESIQIFTLNGLYILDSLEQEAPSILNLLCVLGDKTLIIYQSLYRDLEMLLTDTTFYTGTNPIEGIYDGIILRIQSFLSNKINILKTLSVSEEALLKVNKERNAKLLDIINRTYKLSENPFDHQELIPELISIIQTNNIDAKEAQTLLELEEVDLIKLEEILNNLAINIINKYSDILNKMDGLNLKKSLIGVLSYQGENKSKLEGSFSNLQECISILLKLGFRVDLKKNNIFEVILNKELFESYLWGWDTINS